MSERRVVILLYPGIQALDVVGPNEVFAGVNVWLDRHDRSAPRYAVDLVAGAPGPVASESGLAITATAGLDPAGDEADLLVVPGGNGVLQARRDAAVVEWVRRSSKRSRRTASVCSGTFLLAEAGLLDGRRVATHWSRVDHLARDYPSLEVDPEAIFVRSGHIWTSAGVSAGIDLALALVEDDHGPEAAQTAARWLVVFLRRPGGQSQFSTPVWSGSVDRDGVAAARDLVHADPAADLSVRAMAAHAAMSERNFVRVFSREVGCPPGEYVDRYRVEAARSLLEASDVGVEAIAARVGFGTAETMRRAFHRRLGVSPSDYRSRFRLKEPS